jgi:PhnB protein
MALQPYLFFHGRCDEAIAFYEQSLDAKTAMRICYKDNPEPPRPGTLPDNWGDKVMHAQLQIGDAVLLCSDGHGPEPVNFAGFSLSLTVKDVAEAEKKFHALAAGGNVMMPLGPTFFSPAFGMLSDRFGVHWMIYVTG